MKNYIRGGHIGCLFLYVINERRNDMEEKNITCEIVKSIAVLSENEKGFTKELNLVSWNGADPKYDIRNWHPGRVRSGKGITLTEYEAVALLDALKTVFDNEE